MYKCVIFDLDGTLLNTLDDLYLSVNHALRQFNFPERTKDEVRNFVGNGVVKLMLRSTPENTDENTNEECLNCFREYYLSHMRDNTKAYDGVIELLRALKENKIKTAVVSNKLHSAVKSLCDEIFPDLIDMAIGVKEESERKPSPVNVIKAMQKLGVTESETVYIGDSEVDVQTAENSHLACVGVTWGFRDEICLKKAGANFICNTTDELKKLIFN